MRTFLKLMALCVSTICGTAGTAALANTYPTQPISIVVPVTAGGTSDFFARVIAGRLQEELGVAVVVENRAGAGGIIGSSAVARSKPDGYTLLLASGGTHSINPSVYKNLSYDALNDFAPVIRFAVVPNVLVVPKDLPVSSVKELESYIRDNSDDMTFGSSGVGTSIQLTGEMFKQVADVELLHVPYKGSAPAVTDLIGKHLTLMFDNLPSAMPHVQSNNLKALAVTSAERSPAVPELPTMIEEGYDGFDVTTWFGLLAPAGTPDDTVKLLNQTIASILDEQEIKDRFLEMGAEAAGNDPAMFAQYMEEQIAVWSKVAADAGVQID